MPDYNEYHFTFKELFTYITLGLLCDALFSYIFYRSLISMVFLSPIVIFVLKKKREECKEKRKRKLTVEFREMMNSVIGSLSAGYSIENSFINAYKDMLLLFGKNSYIAIEFGMIAKALKNNRNIENLLEDFGKRSHVNDIEEFSETFKIAKRSGGNLHEMIKRTADIINEKIDVRRKIETIVSSKKFEQNIMNVVPFGIILYLDMTSPGFFNALYGNLMGISIMTVLLIVYIFSYFLAEKITSINI